jgi:stearoyl-CoA desaturase (Delta-9 desaturase)
MTKADLSDNKKHNVTHIADIMLGGEPLVFPEKYSLILRRVQRIHAVSIFVIPLLGTIVAIGLIPIFGVSLTDIIILAILYLMTMVGGSVGLHRLLSHKSFQTTTAIRILLVVFGCMTAQGTPLYWASNHRRHHQFSDQYGDPHSPYIKDEQPLGLLRGFWHSHTGWSFDHAITNPYANCKDLLSDPVIMKINRLYFFWLFLGLLLPTLIGGVISRSWGGAFTALLWGGFVRIFMSYHFTCSINSVAHMWGDQPFRTREHSRNVLWLALPTVGEAWHNNHHAFVGSPFFGLYWWQVDIGGMFVFLLEQCGLAWDVKRPTKDMLKRASRQSVNLH